MTITDDSLWKIDQQVLLQICLLILLLHRGPRSVVGTATAYDLDGPGIKSRWERGFPHLSGPALGPTQVPKNGYRNFPGGKAAGAWRSPPTSI
jgi:hypothetical protein